MVSHILLLLKRICVIVSLNLYSILEIFESLDEKDETDATTWMKRIMK
jgi:hypothetical protein